MAHIKQLRAITDEFTMGKELGRGTYGTVHLCSRSADPKARDLVIKIIDVNVLLVQMQSLKLNRSFPLVYHQNATFSRLY